MVLKYKACIVLLFLQIISPIKIEGSPYLLTKDGRKIGFKTFEYNEIKSEFLKFHSSHNLFHKRSKFHWTEIDTIFDGNHKWYCLKTKNLERFKFKLVTPVEVGKINYYTRTFKQFKRKRNKTVCHNPPRLRKKIKKAKSKKAKPSV